MKGEGRKIVGVVAWDYQIARIVDRAGVDMVSVGDTVGVNLWGQSNPFEVTHGRDARRLPRRSGAGVSRALVSVRLPVRAAAGGPGRAPSARHPARQGGRRRHGQARRRVRPPGGRRAVTRAGIPVFAQFGITPQTALRLRRRVRGDGPARCAGAGRDARRSWSPRPRRWRTPARRCWTSPTPGPVVGRRGGRGRVDPGRSAASAAGRGSTAGCGWRTRRSATRPSAIDDPPDTYANVARITLDAMTAYADDVRAARQIRGGIPVPNGLTCRPPTSTGSRPATR